MVGIIRKIAGLRKTLAALDADIKAEIDRQARVWSGE